jgi:hypothetical protein
MCHTRLESCILEATGFSQWSFFEWITADVA